MSRATMAVPTQVVHARSWPDLAPLTSGPANLAMLARTLPPALLSWLDTLDPAHLPQADGHGSPEQVAAQLADQVHTVDHPAADLLADDLSALVLGWAGLTGQGHCVARLEVLSDDSCSRFHTDRVGIRLICTYRGPGTWWLPDHAARRHRLGPAGDGNHDIVKDAAEIREVPRGAVAFLKGESFDPRHPAVIHRSPPIEAQGLTRMVLRVDDHRHGCGT